MLTDACFLRLGTTCGASCGACQAEAASASAMNLATVCVYEAQGAGRDPRTCPPPFDDSGGPRASELGACLSDLCPACGL